jgi:hypothetical protein
MIQTRPITVGPTRSPIWMGNSQRRSTITRRYEQEITVGRPGKCPERPVLAITIHDNSMSVVSGAGNDPAGQRFLEAYLAISRVGKRCRCGRDLVATLHQDTPSKGDLRATPITKPHHPNIQKSLAVPHGDAGYSILLPALSAAEQIVKEHPGHHPVLIVFTDFLLFDDYTQPLLDFPAETHAIVLRTTPPAALAAAENITVTAITNDSKPGAVARAVFTGLVATRPDAQPLPTEKLL